jgi:hypothetical protein
LLGTKRATSLSESSIYSSVWKFKGLTEQRDRIIDNSARYIGVDIEHLIILFEREEIEAGGAQCGGEERRPATMNV